jgi:hypothetical protein
MAARNRTMTDLRRLGLAAFLLLVAVPARAQYGDEQPTNDVPGMVIAPTALPPLGQRTPDALILARPDVQADLRLSAEQRRRFARFGEAVRERQNMLDEAADQTNQNVFSPLPMTAVDSFQSQQADVDDEIESGIAAILSRPQRTRFTQIRLQLDGPMAFTRPALREKLVVDDDQADAILATLATAREEMVQNAQFPLSTRDVPRRDGRRPAVETEPERTLEAQLAEARVANERVRDAAMGRIGRILRKHQWELYIKLRGAPFVQRGTPPKPTTASPSRVTPDRRRPRPASEPD